MVMDSNELIDVELRRKDEQLRLSSVDIQSLHGRIDKLTREKRKAEFDLEQVYASYSWRAAGFLRGIRYLVWTIPNLSFQWGQRIFLDKGLIKKTSLKVEKKNAGQGIRAQQNKQQNKRNTVNKNKIHGQQSLPEHRDSLLLAHFETKYVLEPNPASSIWNQESLLKSTQSGIADYNLRNPGIFRRQAKQALEMGIDGFCYQYDESTIDDDFDGPIMNHYRNTDTELSYCVSWSNESVSAEKFNLLESFHLRKFIDYCGGLFDDTRYVYHQSQPVIVICGLSKHDELLAKKVWTEWAEEKGEVMPLILSRHGVTSESFVDVSSIHSAEIIREQLAGGFSHKMLTLDKENIASASAILSNIRRFSSRGELTLLDSWNNWDNEYVLESNDASLQKLKSAMKRVTSSFLQKSRYQIAIAITADTDTDYVEQIEHYSREMGLRPRFLLLDESDREFVRVNTTKLYGKNSLEFFDAVLLRLEREGCHTILSLGALDKNLNTTLISSGWHIARLDGAIDLTRDALRNALQDSRMYLPRISVICEVLSSTEVQQIYRFISQIEKQYVVPVEIIFIGSYQGKLATSESALNIIYRQGEMSDVVPDVKGELVWLTQIETMPPKYFLKEVSNQLGDNCAVVYPVECVSEENGIRGREAIGQAVLRTRTKLTQNDFIRDNRLGRFTEVILHRSDLVHVVNRFLLLEGTFHVQIDWLMWLLVAEKGAISVEIQGRIKCLAARREREVDNSELELKVIESYLGRVSNARNHSHFHKENWPEIEAKLIQLDKVIGLHSHAHEQQA